MALIDLRNDDWMDRLREGMADLTEQAGVDAYDREHDTDPGDGTTSYDGLEAGWFVKVGGDWLYLAAKDNGNLILHQQGCPSAVTVYPTGDGETFLYALGSF